MLILTRKRLAALALFALIPAMGGLAAAIQAMPA